MGSVFYKYINPIGEGSSPRSHQLPEASLENMKGVGAETSSRRKRLNLGKVGSAADRPGLVRPSDERFVWQGLDDQSEKRILELWKSLKSRVMGDLDFLLPPLQAQPYKAIPGLPTQLALSVHPFQFDVQATT